MDSTEVVGTDAPGVIGVGRVSELMGLTVRTLHHYDEIGLVVPSERSAAGYRLYTEADLVRLRHVVVYRRLGFPLAEVAGLLEASPPELLDRLQRRRKELDGEMAALAGTASDLERAIRDIETRSPPMNLTSPNLTSPNQASPNQASPNQERTMTYQISKDELKELFGDGYDEAYEVEAEQRWGETEAWAQSRARTSRYTKQDWAAIKAEGEAVMLAFAAALDAGEPATSEAAMDAAEAHRRQINDRFYDLGYPMHRGLADMYLADPRFTATYEAVRPGLAQYVHDAVHANADRHEGRPTSH